MKARIKVKYIKSIIKSTNNSLKFIASFILFFLFSVPIFCQSNRIDIDIIWKGKQLMKNSKKINRLLVIDTAYIFNEIENAKWEYPSNIDSINFSKLSKYQIVNILITFKYKKYNFNDSITVAKDGWLSIKILDAPLLKTNTCKKAHQVSINNHLAYGYVTTCCMNKNKKKK